MMRKKVLAVLFGTMMLSVSLTGCGTKQTAGFNSAKEITVVSREDGSGTRGAFIELFGIEEKDANGNKVDLTKDDANITNSTSVMMTTVHGDEYAIGYISLGSMNDSIKAIDIDGAEASIANVKNGSYKIARPFNIVTLNQVSDVAQDFIQFIMSSEGQAVVEAAGYVSVGDSNSYTSNGATGKVVIAGSSSVSPVMEKLKEAYLEVATGVEIEIQTNDSTAGASATIDGIADIGMCSRAIKDSEKAAGLIDTTIAMDGIAVIVNNNNPVDNLSSDQVYDIYTGVSNAWSDITE